MKTTVVDNCPSAEGFLATIQTPTRLEVGTVVYYGTEQDDSGAHVATLRAMQRESTIHPCVYAALDAAIAAITPQGSEPVGVVPPGKHHLIGTRSAEPEAWGYVSGWNACRDAILATPAPAQQAVTEYDRELIADMLGDLIYDDGYGTKTHGSYHEDAIVEQARLLREADNRDAAGVHTTAQGDS